MHRPIWDKGNQGCRSILLHIHGGSRLRTRVLKAFAICGRIEKHSKDVWTLVPRTEGRSYLAFAISSRFHIDASYARGDAIAWPITAGESGRDRRGTYLGDRLPIPRTRGRQDPRPIIHPHGAGPVPLPLPPGGKGGDYRPVATCIGRRHRALPMDGARNTVDAYGVIA